MSNVPRMIHQIFSLFCFFSYVTTSQLPFYGENKKKIFENIVYAKPDIPNWLGRETRDCLLKVS